MYVTGVVCFLNILSTKQVTLESVLRPVQLRYEQRNAIFGLHDILSSWMLSSGYISNRSPALIYFLALEFLELSTVWSILSSVLDRSQLHLSKSSKMSNGIEHSMYWRNANSSAYRPHCAPVLSSNKTIETHNCLSQVCSPDTRKMVRHGSSYIFPIQNLQFQTLVSQFSGRSFPPWYNSNFCCIPPVLG